MKKLLFLLIHMISVQLCAQDTIRYIANEGLMIQSGSRRVLIDALFDNYYPTFLSPTLGVVEEIMEKNPPYGEIDLFLSTHAHRDHFYSKMVLDFLKAHEETSFVGTFQAVDSMRMLGSDYDEVSTRLIGYGRVESWQNKKINDLQLRTIYVRHGGRQNYDVDNLVFLIKINGKNIIHLGDAEMDLKHFSGLDIVSENIDVALIPYWFLAYPPGVEIINKYIRPTKIIAIHYPKVGDPKSLKAIRENFPEAVVFTETGETFPF
ncbi:MAG: MBL fold metallo-hydrolase [Reichenbachiella sp.]|uniref:MBL fold metallo-hydrolase n=1 Tax=Reichenbachiella sp. TaxID=2184521 RepID=UPI003265E1C1